MHDAETLFPLHWAELALDQSEIKPDCDHDRYLELDRLGMLFVLTARVDGRLVGYSVWFLHKHFHYKTAGLMALTDMYYLLPEYRRGAGARMFVAAERGLRARGAVRAHTSCKVHQDHEKLLKLLGWKFTDKTFSKLLR